MKFYSFEGLDGCGKSTAMASVAEMLKSDGKKVITTREPGGTPLGEAIRNYLLKDTSVSVGKRAEALLFAASRAQLFEDLILLNKDEDVIILCDRFIDSSLAYQGVGNDLGFRNIEIINDFGLNGFRPNGVFYIDIPESERLKRLGNDKLDKIESRDTDFFDKVRKGFNDAGYNYLLTKKYYNQWGEEYNHNFYIIDGTKTPSEVALEIYNLIKLCE